MLRLILSLIALIVLGDTSQAQSYNNAKKCVTEVEQNDLDLAIDHCTAAIQSGELSDQELAAAFHNRGLAYYHKKEYDRAIEDYDHAIRLNPNDSIPSIAGGSRTLKRMSTTALSRTSMKLSSSSLTVSQLCRNVAWPTKPKETTTKPFEIMIERSICNQTMVPAFIRRANAHQEKRQYERALADYEAATQADPKLASERSKGFLLFYLGRMTQSAEMFEKHMKSDPDDTWVILFRYLVEAKIGNALRRS